VRAGEPVTTLQPAEADARAGRGFAETVLPKIPFFRLLQTVAYSAAATQVAEGVTSAWYVAITQATYFGFSFRNSWNNLNVIWHFAAIPLIGGWLSAHWEVGRHIYGRDSPEAIVGYALVAMVILHWRNLKTPLLGRLLDRLHSRTMPGEAGARPGAVDRLLLRLHVPTPWQKRDTSLLQFIFLPVSILLTAIPGQILVSVPLFLGMALATKQGYHSSWLTPASPWVAIVIGIGGGRLYGHKPAMKAGQTINKWFLQRRLEIWYAAKEILVGALNGSITADQALRALTSMRSAEPGPLYPYYYQQMYKTMRATGQPVPPHSRWSTLAFALVVVVIIAQAGYGLYVRKYGVVHGYWAW
jgi:hypothetical protein